MHDAMPCAACGGAMAWCEVGLDADALRHALASGDAAAVLALRPWQCTVCGADVPHDTAAHADALLARMRDEHAAYRDARARADAARARFEARNRRLAREAEEQAAQRARSAAANTSKSAVEAALARARAGKRPPQGT